MNAENLMITVIGCVFCLVGFGIFWAVVKVIAGAIDGVINRPKSTPSPYTYSPSEDSTSGYSYGYSTSDNYDSEYDDDDDDKESSGGFGSFIWENIRPPDDLLDGSFLFPSSNKDDDDDD